MDNPQSMFVSKTMIPFAVLPHHKISGPCPRVGGRCLHVVNTPKVTSATKDKHGIPSRQRCLALSLRRAPYDVFGGIDGLGLHVRNESRVV